MTRSQEGEVPAVVAVGHQNGKLVRMTSCASLARFVELWFSLTGGIIPRENQRKKMMGLMNCCALSSVH